MSSSVPSTRDMVELYCLAPFEVRYGHVTYLANEMQAPVDIGHFHVEALMSSG